MMTSEKPPRDRQGVADEHTAVSTVSQGIA